LFIYHKRARRINPYHIRTWNLFMFLRLLQPQVAVTKNVDFLGIESPGIRSISPQLESQKTNAPSFHFAKAKREQIASVPITANISSAGDGGVNCFGKMILSKKQNSPAFGFGTSMREHRAKVHIPKR
jgi:hypothetical protein